MIDATEKDDQALKQGTVIEGKVTFKKNKDAKRNLNINMNWEIKGTETKDKQLWYMR